MTLLLRKVYNSAYRFTDLLTILQPEKWQMEDATRKTFDAMLQSARAQLKDLEEWRSQFSGRPDNADLGEKTVAAIGDLLPSIQAVAAAVTQYESASAAAQFEQSGNQLLDLQRALQSYLADLRTRAERAINTPGLQVEHVNATAAPVTPVTTVAAEQPPLSPDRVKALLNRIYVPDYRLQDLLSQEHPEKWQAPEAERTAFSGARETLASKLKALEQMRAQFSGRPTSADLAFQTYIALDAVLPPLESISLSVAKYEDAKLAAEYTERGSQLGALQQELAPYISFFLRNQDHTNQMLENNLTSCQNQLGYAMHSRVEPATPLPNVNPIFQGHPRMRHAVSVAAKPASHHTTRKTSTRQKAEDGKRKAESSKKQAAKSGQ